MSLRVIKLGGSLLSLPDWHERFLRWLASEPAAINLLLVGGGELVDVLRREHERFPYPERQMHFAALAAMDLNAELALARLTGSIIVDHSMALQRLLPPVLDRGETSTSSLFIVRMTTWWRAAAVAGEMLPEESWRVTSDTLAAWIAKQQRADELVLLKSCPPHAQETKLSLAETWAKLGYVDACFPGWVRTSLCYRAVNLA